MINATNALEITNALNIGGNDSWNLREILYATIRGKTECQVFLGRELTEEELEIQRKKYLNLGYRIIREDVSTCSGGWREPEYNHPPEYRAIISWNNN